MAHNEWDLLLQSLGGYRIQLLSIPKSITSKILPLTWCHRGKNGEDKRYLQSIL